MKFVRGEKKVKKTKTKLETVITLKNSKYVNLYYILPKTEILERAAFTLKVH